MLSTAETTVLEAMLAAFACAWSAGRLFRWFDRLAADPHIKVRQAMATKVNDRKMARLGFLFDFLTGALVVVGARCTLGSSAYQVLIVAFAAILGRLCPLGAKSKWGRGGATLLGIATAIQPLVGLPALAVWLIAFSITGQEATAYLSAISCIIAAQPVGYIAFRAGVDACVALAHQRFDMSGIRVHWVLPGMGLIVMMRYLVSYRDYRAR